jgi:hypothetical protein
MLAGTAAADLTPDPKTLPNPSLRLQGHAPCPPAEAVLHPLEVRALMLRDGNDSAAIATIDVIGVTAQTTRRVRAEVQRRTRIPIERILIAASHTHCAPATLPALGLVPDEAWLRRVETKLVDCLVRAAEKTEPVTLGLGCGSAYFNVNRRPIPPNPGFTRNYAGVIDRRVRVLRLERADGSTLATLFHYACHPTAKSGREAMISPDYPGVARRYIEEALGGVALFMPSCFGNLRPEVVDAAGEFTSATAEQLDELGRELADAVVSASRYLKCRDAAGLDGRLAAVDLPYGPPMERGRLEAMAGDKDSPFASVMQPWAKRVLGLIDARTLPGACRGEVQWLRVGPVGVVAIGGEAVLEIGQAIEKSLRGKKVPKLTGVEDVWSCGYTNDMVGYLCTRRQHAEGGYEPTAYPWFDKPAPFDGEEEALVRAAQGLLDARSS